MRRSISFILALFLLSCQKETDSFLPNEKFNSIFENPSEGVRYEPVDLIQTEDDGFLILSKSNSNQVFVLKVNPRGEFVWSNTMSSAYINPIGNLIQNQGKYYFIVSAISDKTAVLVEVDDLLQSIEPIRSYTGFRRPLAFDYLNPDNYLLLTNNDTIGAVLSKIQNGFAMEWARAYDDIRNANEKLDAYLNANDPQFFVGAYNNGENIYFNAYRSDGLTLTYTDGLGIETGKISSPGRGGVNSITKYSNGAAALNYTIGSQSFFKSQVEVAATDSTAIEIIEGQPLPDRTQNKKAISFTIELSTSSYLVNSYTTVDGRIKLSFYEAGSGSLSAIEYVGGADPMEVISIVASKDEGLVILAQTTLAGIRQRIELLKIPKKELIDLL